MPPQGERAQAECGSEDEDEVALARQGDTVGATSPEKSNPGDKTQTREHDKRRKQTRGKSKQMEEQAG